MAQMLLAVAEEGADDQYAEELALQLRRELLELDVDSVEPVTTEAPEGARAGLGMVAGLLEATLNPANITAVIGLVIGWVKRSPAKRSVRVELDGDVLELDNADPATLKALTEAFLARHAKPAPA
jgi:hypothetical protein